jgi:phosphate transport system protein
VGAVAGDLETAAVTTPTKPHLEAALQHDIDLIRAKLLDMAALDERALTRALQAFLDGNRQLAYSVILRDQDVDAFETELDRLCVEFITRHQPAAGHLRFVYSASKIVGALERIGDYAESIARQVLLANELPYDVPTDKYSEIAGLAIPMLHNAMRAFLDRNADLARTTKTIEPRVNQVRDAINADLVAWRAEGRLPLEALPPLITVARRFERVSDQATNICEEALYFATGEYQRHMTHEGFRVVFLDAANDCLSQMAEAIANSLGARRFTFASAGNVAGAIDPRVIQFLAKKGIDASHQKAKAVADIPAREQVQVMVALCGEAQKSLPHRPAKTLGIDWAVPDPCAVRGTPADVEAAYEAAYASLTDHINDLVQAILDDPTNDHHVQA